MGADMTMVFLKAHRRSTSRITGIAEASGRRVRKQGFHTLQSDLRINEAQETPS